jgi:hypothetical protein
MVEEEYKPAHSLGFRKRTIDLANLTTDDVDFAMRVIYRWMSLNRKLDSMSRWLAPNVGVSERNFIATLMQQTLGQKFASPQSNPFEEDEVKQVVEKIKQKESKKKKRSLKM